MPRKQRPILGPRNVSCRARIAGTADFAHPRFQAIGARDVYVPLHFSSVLEKKGLISDSLEYIWREVEGNEDLLEVVAVNKGEKDEKTSSPQAEHGSPERPARDENSPNSCNSQEEEGTDDVVDSALDQTLHEMAVEYNEVLDMADAGLPIQFGNQNHQVVRQSEVDYGRRDSDQHLHYLKRQPNIFYCSGARLDKDALFEATPDGMARYIASRVFNATVRNRYEVWKSTGETVSMLEGPGREWDDSFNEAFGADTPSSDFFKGCPLSVLDLCCGVGSNTIAFLRLFPRVYALDKSRERAELLLHNVERHNQDAGVDGTKLQVAIDDAFSYIESLQHALDADMDARIPYSSTAADDVVGGRGAAAAVVPGEHCCGGDELGEAAADPTADRDGAREEEGLKGGGGGTAATSADSKTPPKTGKHNVGRGPQGETAAASAAAQTTEGRAAVDTAKGMAEVAGFDAAQTAGEVPVSVADEVQGGSHDDGSLVGKGSAEGAAGPGGHAKTQRSKQRQRRGRQRGLRRHYLCYDAIFVSPPWGGPGYGRKPPFRLAESSFGVSLQTLVTEALT
eukprot:GHVU01171167.1.p1 GENE.GHVU01171167.1~~GHVU01171167.1.p1  ORF type:complete len:567 (-),score=75.83 GHVU01171167.1:829-2529(-)